MKRFLLIALTLSMLLTACGKNQACTEDPLGCVTIEKYQPLTIAVALTLSGPDSPYGIDALRGVEIAIQDQGDLLGRAIKLEQQDELCSKEGGEAAAQTLAGMPQVIGVIGTTCSSAAVPAAQILSDAGMVLISPSSTAASLTASGAHQAGFLRTIYNDKSQAKLVAEFAFVALGARRMVTIHDGAPYSLELQKEVCLSFKQMGGQCLDQVQMESGKNPGPILEHIANLNPDVLYYPVYTVDGAGITMHVSDVGLNNAALIGSDGLLNSDFLQQAGRDAQGMYISGPVISEIDPEFYAKYIARYGEKPVAVYAAQAYDAAMILFAAIEKVAIKDGSTIQIPRQALREALFATSDFQGLSGVITCSPAGDCSEPNLQIYQVRLTKFEPIYP